MPTAHEVIENVTLIGYHFGTYKKKVGKIVTHYRKYGDKEFTQAYFTENGDTKAIQVSDSPFRFYKGYVWWSNYGVESQDEEAELFGHVVMLDRFLDKMDSINQEIKNIENGPDSDPTADGKKLNSLESQYEYQKKGFNIVKKAYEGKWGTLTIKENPNG